MKNDKKRPDKKIKKQETTKIITLKIMKDTKNKKIVY